MELTQYADATLFLVRLDYTKKGMLQLINSKYKKGEIKSNETSYTTVDESRTPLLVVTDPSTGFDRDVKSIIFSAKSKFGLVE